MEKNKKYTDLPESIMDLTDAEFLSFLYSQHMKVFALNTVKYLLN